MTLPLGDVGVLATADSERDAVLMAGPANALKRYPEDASHLARGATAFNRVSHQAAAVASV